MKTLLTLLLVSLGLRVAAAPTMSCDSYRFTNGEGVTELSNSIPPEMANRGYSCIKDGKVVQVVPPKLSPTAQEQREHDEETEKAAKEAGLPRPRSNEELERLYASPCDVESSRSRKILSIDSAVKAIKANLEGLKLKKQGLEEQAADREREGLSPSAEILDNLKAFDTQIIEAEHDIAKRQIEKQHAIGQFELDLDGMKRLHPAPCAR